MSINIAKLFLYLGVAVSTLFMTKQQVGQDNISSAVAGSWLLSWR